MNSNSTKNSRPISTPKNLGSFCNYPKLVDWHENAESYLCILYSKPYIFSHIFHLGIMICISWFYNMSSFIVIIRQKYIKITKIVVVYERNIHHGKIKTCSLYFSWFFFRRIYNHTTPRPINYKIVTDYFHLLGYNLRPPIFNLNDWGSLSFIKLEHHSHWNPTMFIYIYISKIFFYSL